jgi:hypothetical protein
MKFAVGYPWTSPFMYTQFGENMANLQAPDGVEVRFFRGTGWCPARRHISICEQALEWGAELICIIGADQLHPEDMLQRLYARFLEGYDVVAALVPCRGYIAWQPMKPFQPMAWRFKTNDEMGSTKIRQYRSQALDGDMIHMIKREDGDMVRANFIGSGVIMFHVDYLLSLKKPWFYETVTHENQEREASMDTKFSWRLQEEAGATLWVDTTIIVNHLNIFKIDDSFQNRFDDWVNIPPEDEIVSTKPKEGAKPYTKEKG